MESQKGRCTGCNPNYRADHQEKIFVIDPRVQGKVSLVSHKAMTPDENLSSVLIHVCKFLGYAAVPSGDVIKVVPSSTAKQIGGRLAGNQRPGKGDEVVVRVIRVRNMLASQLVPMLRPLMQQWASINAYAPSNTLIIAGGAGNINRLIDIIHNMDKKNANTVSVIQLKHANAKNVVSILNNLQNIRRSQGQVIDVAMAADEQNNSIFSER